MQFGDHKGGGSARVVGPSVLEDTWMIGMRGGDHLAMSISTQLPCLPVNVARLKLSKSSLIDLILTQLWILAVTSGTSPMCVPVASSSGDSLEALGKLTLQ